MYLTSAVSKVSDEKEFWYFLKALYVWWVERFPCEYGRTTPNWMSMSHHKKVMFSMYFGIIVCVFMITDEMFVYHTAKFVPIFVSFGVVFCALSLVRIILVQNWCFNGVITDNLLQIGINMLYCRTNIGQTSIVMMSLFYLFLCLSTQNNQQNYFHIFSIAPFHKRKTDLLPSYLHKL